MEATEHEVGTQGATFGDVLVQRHPAGRGDRYELANVLRELANNVAATIGDPIDGYEVFVLMNRPALPMPPK